jgi:hypothetical protein
MLIATRAALRVVVILRPKAIGVGVAIKKDSKERWFVDFIPKGREISPMVMSSALVPAERLKFLTTPRFKDEEAKIVQAEFDRNAKERYRQVARILQKCVTGIVIDLAAELNNSKKNPS